MVLKDLFNIQMSNFQEELKVPFHYLKTKIQKVLKKNIKENKKKRRNKKI